MPPGVLRPCPLIAGFLGNMYTSLQWVDKATGLLLMWACLVLLFCPYMVAEHWESLCNSQALESLSSLSAEWSFPIFFSPSLPPFVQWRQLAFPTILTQPKVPEQVCFWNPLVDPVWVQRVLSIQTYPLIRASLLAQWLTIHLPMQETRVWSPGQEDLQGKEIEIHSSILAWETPWTEEPGGLQSMGSEKSQTRLSN